MKNIFFTSRDNILDWFFGVKRKSVLNEGESEYKGARKISNEIANSVLIISQIIKWYESDFGRRVGTLVAIKKYFSKNDMRFKLMENIGKVVMVRFAPYGWHLNGFG